MEERKATRDYHWSRTPGILRTMKVVESRGENEWNLLRRIFASCQWDIDVAVAVDVPFAHLAAFSPTALLLDRERI